MSLFVQALVIMVLGMSLVFVFLYFVILSVAVTARLIRRLAPADAGGAQEDAGTDDERAIVAAVGAAVHAHVAGGGPGARETT